MVTSAVAPYTTTYTSRTPYITAAEYTNAPTGVDVGSLVSGGQPAIQAAQLESVIGRASSLVDIYCQQVLAATADTQSGRYRVQRGGVLRVPCDFTPILEVTAVKTGVAPSQLSAMTDLSDVWIDRKVVTIPAPGTLSSTAGNSRPAAPNYFGNAGHLLVVMTYVNGYPNTLTSTAASAGDTTLVLDSLLGVYAGSGLTISDGQNTEQIGVESIAGSTLTLTNPLLYGHGVGVSVSNLPPSVKQACIALTTALIKTRGSEGIVMGQMREQANQKVPIDSGGMEDVELAKSWLASFRRTG